MQRLQAQGRRRVGKENGEGLFGVDQQLEPGVVPVLEFTLDSEHNIRGVSECIVCLGLGVLRLNFELLT